MQFIGNCVMKIHLAKKQVSIYFCMAVYTRCQVAIKCNRMSNRISNQRCAREFYYTRGVISAETFSAAGIFCLHLSFLGSLRFRFEENSVRSFSNAVVTFLNQASRIYRMRVQACQVRDEKSLRKYLKRRKGFCLR